MSGSLREDTLIRIKHEGVEGWVPPSEILSDELEQSKAYTDQKISEVNNATLLNDAIDEVMLSDGFKDRVLADSGTFESQENLELDLKSLLNIEVE
jgi:hypothetical protein